jgi:hypothetical protein
MLYLPGLRGHANFPPPERGKKYGEYPTKRIIANHGGLSAISADGHPEAGENSIPVIASVFTVVRAAL